MPVICRFGGGAGGGGLPQFTFTGTYTLIDDGNNNWRIKFLTSGTFTPSKNMTIDVFLVGGGQGGNAALGSSGGAGGNGGETATEHGIVLQAGTAYLITVGAGGSSSGGQGGDTSFATICVAMGGRNSETFNTGSGGGNGANKCYAGNGGSDGGNGNGYSLNTLGGTVGTGRSGQGTTTREFGEATGDPYAFGAGGGSYTSGAKGTGGRGNTSGDGGFNSNGLPGFDNTGDGGGGAGFNSGGKGGAGGSGIVVIRNHREVAA